MMNVCEGNINDGKGSDNLIKTFLLFPHPWEVNFML